MMTKFDRWAQHEYTNYVYFRRIKDSTIEKTINSFLRHTEETNICITIDNFRKYIYDKYDKKYYLRKIAGSPTEAIIKLFIKSLKQS